VGTDRITDGSGCAMEWNGTRRVGYIYDYKSKQVYFNFSFTECLHCTHANRGVDTSSLMVGDWVNSWSRHARDSVAAPAGSGSRFFILAQPLVATTGGAVCLFLQFPPSTVCFQLSLSCSSSPYFTNRELKEIRRDGLGQLEKRRRFGEQYR
jgi:hypothetical protein